MTKRRLTPPTGDGFIQRKPEPLEGAEPVEGTSLPAELHPNPGCQNEVRYEQFNARTNMHHVRLETCNVKRLCDTCQRKLSRQKFVADHGR